MASFPRVSKFLGKIKQLESSGGKDFGHQTITNPESVQYGTTAIGNYGLMPNTVKELINRRRINGTITPDMQELDEKTPDDIKTHLETHPELEQQLAEDLANHVLKKQQGDEDKAAYSWKFGHNTPPENISDETLNNSGRVQEFRRLKTLMDKPNPDDSEGQ